MTLAQYEQLWTPELFAQKGRGRGTLVMGRRDPGQGWHPDNVVIQERIANQHRYTRYKQERGLTNRERLFKIRDKEK